MRLNRARHVQLFWTLAPIFEDNEQIGAPIQITVEIPDELAAPLVPAGQDPARTALEAMGIEAYREHRITGYQLRRLLGVESRYALDGLLKQHQVWLEYSTEDFERERELGERLWLKRQAELAEEAERQRRAG